MRKITSKLTSIRLSLDVLKLLEEYQRDRRVYNTNLAMNQMMRMGGLLHRFMVAPGDIITADPKTWYQLPEDYSIKTELDEMPIERVRAMLHRFITRNYTQEDLEWLRDLTRKSREKSVVDNKGG